MPGQELPRLDHFVAIAFGASSLGNELGEVQRGPLEVARLHGGAGRSVDGGKTVRRRPQRGLEFS